MLDVHLLTVPETASWIVEERDWPNVVPYAISSERLQQFILKHLGLYPKYQRLPPKALGRCLSAFKPALGSLFVDELRVDLDDYSHFGFFDMDLLVGNLSAPAASFRGRGERSRGRRRIRAAAARFRGLLADERRPSRFRRSCGRATAVAADERRPSPRTSGSAATQATSTRGRSSPIEGSRC